MKATLLEILKPEPPKNPMKDLFDVLFDTIFPIFLCTPRESRIRSMDPSGRLRGGGSKQVEELRQREEEEEQMST